MKCTLLVILRVTGAAPIADSSMISNGPVCTDGAHELRRHRTSSSSVSP